MLTSPFPAVLHEVGELVVEVCGGADPAEEIYPAHEFVGGVRVLIRKAEPEKDRIEAEDLLELHDDRDRAPLALVDRLLPEPLLEGNRRGPHARAVDRSERRLAAVKIGHLDLQRFGRDLSYILFEELRDDARLLVGNQAHRYFRMRLRGKNRFRTLSRKPSPDPVAFERRAHPEPLEGRVSLLAVETADTKIAGIPGIRPGKFLDCRAFFFAEGPDVTVEAGDDHPPVLVVEARDHFRERLDGIVDRSSEGTGVKVSVRAR